MCSLLIFHLLPSYKVANWFRGEYVSRTPRII
nr:MAG TPA: hypothetical protein [Caudoviricetes sp.]DAT80963.1 MAG TPA: hypothetical protein [Caudoviricetes sp.]DAU20593.1 MAG TPA: hypothetical protein [Caudoviricetes sp.]DAX89431.1 MAG TPA: hypothetical protein [Caudoviricetes sp.]